MMHHYGLYSEDVSKRSKAAKLSKLLLATRRLGGQEAHEYVVPARKRRMSARVP